MHRLPLLLCLVALAGSAVSAFLFFQIGNSKQLLELRLTEANQRTARLDRDLTTARDQAGVLNARIGALDNELAGTRTRATALEARGAELDRELARVKGDLAAAQDVVGVYELTARALAEEVKTLRQDLEESRTSNASPEAVAAYKSTIAELERQLATARHGAAVMTAGASTAVFTSRAGRATVLTVGPQNAFVVLNFGAARGAQLGQKMTVSQASAEVAIVQITDVRANFSVAQVLPETLRGILQKGDLAVLIR